MKKALFISFLSFLIFSFHVSVGFAQAPVPITATIEEVTKLPEGGYQIVLKEGENVLTFRIARPALIQAQMEASELQVGHLISTEEALLPQPTIADTQFDFLPKPDIPGPADLPKGPEPPDAKELPEKPEVKPIPEAPKEMQLPKPPDTQKAPQPLDLPKGPEPLDEPKVPEKPDAKSLPDRPKLDKPERVEDVVMPSDPSQAPPPAQAAPPQQPPAEKPPMGGPKKAEPPPQKPAPAAPPAKPPLLPPAAPPPQTGPPPAGAGSPPPGGAPPPGQTDQGSEGDGEKKSEEVEHEEAEIPDPFLTEKSPLSDATLEELITEGFKRVVRVKKVDQGVDISVQNKKGQFEDLLLGESQTIFKSIGLEDLKPGMSVKVTIDQASKDTVQAITVI